MGDLDCCPGVPERGGYSVKAQYFFFANGEQLGSFGQLTSSDGSFKANFDTNYTAISANCTMGSSQEVGIGNNQDLTPLPARVAVPRCRAS